MRVTAVPFLCVSILQAANAQTAGRHIIVIGVDGLSVDAVKTAKMPNLQKLVSHAAWTLQARGVMPTLSSPNWASVIDGAAPEQHGITSNGYFRHMMEIEPVCRDSEGMFPTIFQILRTQRPTSRIAIFHDWSGFADLVEKHAPDVMQHERGAAHTTAAAIEYWQRNHPDLMFVHLDNVDHAGHDSGWESRAYYQAAEEADQYIGQIVAMLEEQSALDSTYVLVTSDHGGKGRGHGKNSLAEIQIPWILSGPEVAPGQVASAVYTYDSAATIAWILGIHPPECWIGRPVVAAFRPAAVVSGNTGDCTLQHPTLGDAPGALALRVHAVKE
jgi:predicted AlkP superfamily pyrophosphatase or phosphodiesterase